MKSNMTSVDRLGRTIVALAIAILYFSNVIQGITGAILLVVASVFVITSFVNFCPLYRVLGIRRWEKSVSGK